MHIITRSRLSLRIWHQGRNSSAAVIGCLFRSTERASLCWLHESHRASISAPVQQVGSQYLWLALPQHRACTHKQSQGLHTRRIFVCRPAHEPAGALTGCGNMWAWYSSSKRSFLKAGNIVNVCSGSCSTTGHRPQRCQAAARSPWSWAPQPALSLGCCTASPAAEDQR